MSEWIMATGCKKHAKSDSLANRVGRKSIEDVPNDVDEALFYKTVELMADLDIVKDLHTRLSSASSLKVDSVVILGVGNFSQLKSQAHHQMALSCCLVQKLQLTSRYCYFFDPLSTVSEVAFVENILKMRILSTDFSGKHKVRGTGKTLFLMFHCPRRLYSHIIWSNWGANLGRVVIVGNSFLSYSLRSIQTSKPPDCVQLMQPFIEEHPVWDKSIETNLKMKYKSQSLSPELIRSISIDDLERALIDTALMFIPESHMKLKDMAAPFVTSLPGNQKENEAGGDSDNAEEEFILSDVLRSKLLTSRPLECDLDEEAKTDAEFIFASTPCYRHSYLDVDGTPFGKELQSKYFHLEHGFINLNHGSFGTCPKAVLAKQFEYLVNEETHLDHWFRNHMYDKIWDSRRTIASLVNGPIEDIVLVENASTAVNSILRSLQFSKGDGVLILSSAYSMVKHTIDWLSDSYGIYKEIVPIYYPILSKLEFEKGILQSIEKCLTKSDGSIKVCIFSHISSQPSMVEPVKEMAELCRKYNVLSIIDGAHAPGQIPIDILEINCDFYTGNCHKWLFAPKGTAFMYVNNSNQLSRSPQPTVISSTGRKDFVGRFAYTGTRDYTAFATLPFAVEHFYGEVLGGREQIIMYCRDLAARAGQLCATMWNTELLIPVDMCGFMINVILPTQDPQKVDKIQCLLDSEHNIYTVGGVERREDGTPIYFMRLSATVYLELEDFRKMAILVKSYTETL